MSVWWITAAAGGWLLVALVFALGLGRVLAARPAEPAVHDLRAR